jgi:hypothetical protein
LISVNAVKDRSNVLLTWQTTNEENLKNYIVEKSIDANVFNQEAVVIANNIGINNYTVTDMNPANGVNYYRLKQIDVDGKFTYSGVRSVNFSKNHNAFVSPNPATNFIKIFADQIMQNIQIIDESGKTIKWLTPSANNVYDISNLQKGIYFLRIITQTGAEILRFAKL